MVLLPSSEEEVVSPRGALKMLEELCSSEFQKGRTRNLDVKEGDWNTLGEEALGTVMGPPRPWDEM